MYWAGTCCLAFEKIRIVNITLLGCRLQEHLACPASSETPRIRIGDDFIQEDGPLAYAGGRISAMFHLQTSQGPADITTTSTGAEGGCNRNTLLGVDHVFDHDCRFESCMTM